MKDQADFVINPELRQYLQELRRQSLVDINVRRQGRRGKLSVEMIFRKTFRDTLREYARNCSLAGVQKMCSPDVGIWERLIRILVFLTAIGMCCYCLYHVWSNTLTNPLIISMESSTYPISDIDFPAVALCNVNRISMKALKQMAKEEYHDLAKRREPIEEVEAMLLQWGRLIDFSYNDTLRKNPIYMNLVEKYMHDTHRVKKIMQRLAPSCDDQLLRCFWAGAMVDCRTIFTLKGTSLGHCCTFNFNMDYTATGELLTSYGTTKRQVEAGRFFGLVVVLDPLSDDYAYSLSNTLGYDVFLLPPINYADPKTGRVIHHKASPNTGIFYALTSTKLVATPEVRKYGVKTRNCLFRDEMPDEFNNMYSYSACIVYCRVKAIQALCKCTPYFVSLQIDKTICTLESLRCLNKYKDKFSYLYPIGVSDPAGLEMEIENSLFCKDCYPDCELTSYSTKSYATPILNSFNASKNFRSSIFKSLNLTNKVLISIYHPHQDATLDRLDVVSYWYEIVSNVGGAMGIIIGFSIISVVELIYFFTIRFTHNFCVNYLHHH